MIKDLNQQRKKRNARSNYIKSQIASNLFICLVTLACLLNKVQAISTNFTDNTCTFKTDGKLFTLALLNRFNDGNFYKISLSNTTWIIFNFCDPFIPKECTGLLYEKKVNAYSFLVNLQSNGLYNCIPYSSDSKTSYFTAQYINANNQMRMNLSMVEKPSNSTQKTTNFILDCSMSNQTLYNLHNQNPTMEKLVIYGNTPYSCPVFQLSNLWAVLTNNMLIFGFIIFVIGFIMLFYGILMTQLMIFITAYFLSFAVFFGIFTAFLRPDSSTVAIYFSLLIILFLSTLLAYGLTKLVNVSIFFIGAFFGFILAAIINTIFSQITGIYSIWSLVFFQVILIIPFGLLTFKYSQQVIVMSTSLVGSYMIVRPISWIFGGFPNEFTLYQMAGDDQLKDLPWTFFLYLIFIIAIAILGAFYQILKIKRKKPGEQIQNNFITQNVQEHLDRIKEAVERIITKMAPQNLKPEDDYQKMNQMGDIKTPQQNYDIQFDEPAKTKQRKSKQENF